MTDDKARRAMMAADLCERAAHEARAGNAECAIDLIGDARVLFVCSLAPAEVVYREAMTRAYVSRTDIDAAVAAIARGKWPADSLVGRVGSMRREADRASDKAQVSKDADYHNGEAGAFDAVLDLLGVKS